MAASLTTDARLVVLRPPAESRRKWRLVDVVLRLQGAHHGLVTGELLEYGGIVGVLSGSVSILASIVVTFFEAFIQLLQAYVFTLLAALYIGGALVDEH